MRYFKVRNLKKFQHYKNRTPPWIKLYNGLLTDYHFLKLRDDAKFHFIAIGLLASRSDNKIPMDCKHVAELLHANMPVNLEEMQTLDLIETFEDDSEELATCPQDAIPERERERETEGEEKTELVNSEQAHELNIEAIGKKMGVKDFNRPEETALQRFMGSWRKHYADKLPPAAFSWLGQQWTRVLGKEPPRDDTENSAYDEWNNKRAKFEAMLFMVIHEILKSGRAFTYQMANGKLYNPNNKELQVQSDAYKQELEDVR